MARYLKDLQPNRGGRQSGVEAAELLGISEPHSRPFRERYNSEGAERMIDRRRGSRGTGSRSWSSSTGRAMIYGEFSMKHLHEALRAEHGFEPSCSWVKVVLQGRGLGEVRPRATLPQMLVGILRDDDAGQGSRCRVRRSPD